VLYRSPVLAIAMASVRVDVITVGPTVSKRRNQGSWHLHCPLREGL